MNNHKPSTNTDRIVPPGRPLDREVDPRNTSAQTSDHPLKNSTGTTSQLLAATSHSTKQKY